MLSACERAARRAFGALGAPGAGTKGRTAMAGKATPLYQQIFEDIKASIENGTYVPQQKIPSEPELSEEYGVSRITVRRAIEELCADGYLVKQQGRGTFVSTPHINRRLLQTAEAQSFSDICRESGMEPGAELVNRQIVPARPDEASFLELGPGALLLYIQRVRTADRQPIFEENIFLPYEPYQELLTAPLEDASIFDEIARVCRVGAELGIRRIKLTGGEPLVRRGLPELVGMLKGITGIEQVTLTTNGTLLKEQINGLVSNGLDAVNISIDTLHPERYREITRGGSVEKALEGLDAAAAVPGLSVKVNCVPLKERQQDQI